MQVQQSMRFEKLYKEHQRMVRGVLYNMVNQNQLDDLVQETFIKIWKALPRFSFFSSEKTWIYRITIDTAIDFLKRNVPPTVKLSEQIPEAYQDRDFQQEIQSALQSLDEMHRTVLILFYFEELDIGQISKTLDVPDGTVKSRLSIGRQKAKIFLQKKEGGFHEIFNQSAQV